MVSNLSLSEPFQNCVYQRDNNGSAFIPVVGIAPGATQVTATFQLQKVGDVQTLDYALPISQTIQVDAAGNFAGRVTLPGGWYSLVVSAGGEQITVNRVGAGEVFILFGHSYMSGGSDTSHQIYSTDERVITLQDTLGTVDYNFGQLKQLVGPFGSWPESWGMLGDKLVKRLGVPVMFYGCAYGGSNILQNYEVINSLTRTSLPPGTHDPTSRQPFAPIEAAMNIYIPKTGVRGVLMEHGFNDRGTPTDTFIQRFKNVMDYVRNHWEKQNLAIVLVQEQLTEVQGSLYDIPTAQGIQQLISTYPNTFKGVDFNAPQWASAFKQHNHLFGYFIDQFATDWDAALTTAFFANSTPYLSESILLGASSNGVTSYSAGAISLSAIDWATLAGLATLLVLIFWKQKRSFMIGFLLLAMFGLGRLTNKV